MQHRQNENWQALQELAQMEQEIIESYADINGEDIMEIPEINDAIDYWD